MNLKREPVSDTNRLVSLTISFFVAILILLAACGNRGPSEEALRRMEEARIAREADEAARAPRLAAQAAALEEAANREIETDLRRTVRLSAQQYENFRAFTDALYVYFPHAEIFHLDEALERYRAIIPVDGPRELRLLAAELCGTQLFDAVSRNNPIFFEQATGMDALYGPHSDDFLRRATEIIADTVNRERPFLLPQTVYDLEYRLENLRIVQPRHPGQFGSVVDCGLMTLMTASPTFAGSMDKTIVHETMHLLQLRSCAAREAAEFRRFWGFNFAADDLPSNSLMWWWFIEAAAERLAVDLIDGKPTNYHRQVRLMDMLTLALNDAHPQALARLTMQPHLDALFELFGANTPKRQTELLRLMYAIDIVEMPAITLMFDFWRLYEREILGREADADDKYAYRIALEESIYTVIGKYFYENFARRLAAEEIPLEDIFKYIAIFEAAISTQLRYAPRGENLTRFFENYTHIKEAFFSVLAEALQVTPEILLADYDSFNARIGRVPRSYERGLLNPIEGFFFYADFSWLCENKNTLLTLFYDDVMRNKTVSVRQFSKIREAL